MTIEQKIKDLEKAAEVYRNACVPCGDIEQEIEWLTDYRNRLRKEIEYMRKSYKRG